MFYLRNLCETAFEIRLCSGIENIVVGLEHLTLALSVLIGIVFAATVSRIGRN